MVFGDCLVAAGREGPGGAVHLLGGSVVRAGDRKIAREGNRAQHYRETNDSARRGDFWDGLAVSCAGICARLSVVAVDGFAARRRAKYSWAFHDAHGRAALGDGEWR